MSDLNKIVVHLDTVPSKSYTVTVAVETLAEMERPASVAAVIEGMADALKGEEGSVKMNVDGIGWVVFNLRHVAAIEFHGTEDVE